MRVKKFAAVAASLGTIRNYDGNGNGDDKVIKQKVKAPSARMRFTFLRFGLRSARIQWRRSPKTHVSKRSPVWRFLKTPVYRFHVDGRKRRFSNTMMSYIKQRMPCKTCYIPSVWTGGNNSNSPLWGCAGERVEMVVKCAVGPFWRINLPHVENASPKTVPRSTLPTNSTRSPAQPQSAEYGRVKAIVDV